MKFIKLTIYTLTFLISLGFVNRAYGATEFVSVVDTGNGTGTDYTSLNAWETGVQTNLTAATTLVFAGTKTGTMADNASVTGASSLATATIVHVTATQILLENISGTFQSGEQIQIDGSNYFTTSDAGDSAIAVAKCRASTGAADTTAVTITGWTTSATNYIKVWTDPSEGYRHEGKWDDGKYRLETATNGIVINEEYERVEGVQIKTTLTSVDSVVGILLKPATSTSSIIISSCIVAGVISGTTNYAYGIMGDSGGTYYIQNTLVYNYTNGTNSLGGIYSNDADAIIYSYNNTTVGNYRGYGVNSGTVICKNCIGYDNIDSDYAGAFNASSTNNLSKDATAPAYNTYYINKTVTFADEANKDFHLAQSDIDAKNVGYDLSADANLPFSTDIDGSTRTGTWDIGADEAAIQVFYSVGQNTNDHKTRGSYVQDNFNRSDANPIGGNWSVIASEDPFRIVSNQIVATVTGSNGVYWNANTFDDDQYSQATIKTVSGTYIGVMTRIASSAKTYYFFGSGTTSSYVLGKYVSGSWTVINTYAETQAVNDVIKLRAVGTTLTPTLNGTDLQSFTDSSISSGSLGIHTYGSTSTALDDWEGGNLGGSLIAPIMTISSGVATFSVAQTATNMGVGDKVTYNTTSIAYISEKVSSTTWKLITATGGTPGDVSGQTVNSIAHPFASLSAAEAGADDASYLNTPNLVTGNYQLNIPCYYDTGADTTAVTINGWITGSANYIKVYTPNNTTNEVNLSQRHDGKWSDTAYKMEFTGTGYLINILDNYIAVEGLQAYKSNVPTTLTSLFTVNAADVIFDSCIARGPGRISYSGNHIAGFYALGSGYVFHKNCLAYDFYDSSMAWRGYGYSTNSSGAKAYYYNCSAINCRTGFNNYSYSAIFFKNCLAQDGGDGWYNSSATAGSTNNCSDISGDAPGTNARNGVSVVFADEANDDFHLTLEDTGARGFGANLSNDTFLKVLDDIDGQTRPGDWDIGADQYFGAIANSKNSTPANLENGLIGYWSFDSPDTTWTSDTTGTTDDLSGNNYDGTLTNMSQSSSPSNGKVGQAFDFDGVDDYVSAGDINELDGASQLTLSAWVYRTNGTNGINIEKSSNTLYAFGINITSQIFFKVANTQNASGYLSFSNRGWVHLVMVFDGTQTGNENRLKGYINNVPQTLSWWGGYDVPATTQVGNSANLLMGRSDAYDVYSKGKIDEVRIYNRALSVDEVGQLYQSGASKMQPNSVLSKPAGLASGLVGHWSFNGPDTAWTSATAGTTNDLSGNGHTGTLTNMSRSASPALGKLGQALKFDGVNDCVDAGSASSLDDIQISGTGLTASMWVKNNQYTNSQPMLIGKGNANYNGYWHLFLDNNDPSIRFMKDFSGSSDLSVRADYPNTYLGQFKHIVLTWDGSSSASNVHFYIDGLEVSKTSSVDGDGSAVSDAALNISIGLSVIDSTLPFNGLMDDARIYNRVLSADEVADLYRTGQMKILKQKSSPR